MKIIHARCSSPYESDHVGRRARREADLVNLVSGLLGFTKQASILIYALGKNNTLSLLKSAGYTNAWGSDISDDLPYSDRFINVAKHPDYFKKHGIKFDVVVAVEVWEHYDRHSMNDSFRNLFEMIKPTGIVIGTTGIWSAQNDCPDFDAPDEWGQGQLKWWDYPYADDHTSFYREQNLAAIADRFGMSAFFAYFSNDASHITDPFKRIIALTHKTNQHATENLQKKFHRHFHNVFY